MTRKVILRDEKYVLTFQDLPSHTHTNSLSPFFRSIEHPLNKNPPMECRLFVPRIASATNGRASLATVLVAISRMNPVIDWGFTSYFDEVERIGGLKIRSYQIMLDTLRHAVGEIKFPHGVHIIAGPVWRIPSGLKRGEDHHFLIMEPFGFLLEELTAGTLHRVAIQVRSVSDEIGFFRFIVTGIKCEDKDDALTLAYAIEALELDYRLY